MPFTEHFWIEELEKAKQHLRPDEEVVHWSDGVYFGPFSGELMEERYGAVPVLVMATNRRIVLYILKEVNRYEIKDLALSAITSIEVDDGASGYSATFNCSNIETKVTQMNLGNPKGIIDCVRSAVRRRIRAEMGLPNSPA